MKALVFHKMHDVRVDTVEDPKIEAPRDAIIRVTSTAICGSDLHIYNGFIPQAKPMTLGHEFMGIVEEVGSGVGNLKKGDRVVVPFPIACGHCHFCDLGLVSACEESNPEFYGPDGDLADNKGGALFGYTDFYGGYQGGQAEYVRVPYADFGPRKISDQFTDEQMLFLTDIFPTGYTAIDWAQMQGGETVAVFGCGPVGLMAMKVAWLKGAKRVIGLDSQPYRLAMAEKASGAETINITDGDPVEALRAMTEGRGPEVCVDAVGMEADRSTLDRLKTIIHMEKGTDKVIDLCFKAVRRGGHVSIIGVYGSNYDNFPVARMFDKGIKLHAGQANVQKHIDTLIEWVESGKIKLDDIITHRLPLSKAPHGYDIFNKKEDNCVKVVLKPGL